MFSSLFVFRGFAVSGVITVPVSASMYQTMVANIQHLHTNSDGTVCVTPVVQVPKVKVNNCRVVCFFLLFYFTSFYFMYYIILVLLVLKVAKIYFSNF